MQSVQQIADGIMAEWPEDKKVVLLFTIGQSKNQGQFVLVCNDKQVFKTHKKDLLAVIDGRGGGTDQRLQGNANNLKDSNKLLKIIADLLGITYQCKNTVSDENENEKKETET
ncbi:hypothetical protein RFI_03171 [Reticulomyxa filosa]|uniref:DHHA1 domain-containing protein n=1 Tax=Reticulomyxa filosa TaxID=46433 RepID=X6P739_RETFI|nr:hypothetical protein RFI_03171 [Reticulomyxa filosa]|eukprot:ETO33923.1 hypothetical protein RFI_03171 [Reticulomyxa filosa]